MLLKKRKIIAVAPKDQLKIHYGLGYSRIKTINNKLGICSQTTKTILRVDQAAHLDNLVKKEYPLLNHRLKQDLSDITKFLDQVKNNRSIRNKKGYPSRGQRTKTNGKTKKKFRI